MSVFGAFAKGTARIWLHKRLILWLYGMNLAFAAVILFPLRKVVQEVSKTDLADGFLTGFPLDVGLEFWSQHRVELKTLAYVAVGLGILYLLVNVYLAGGIVAALAAERRVSLRRFMNDAARYFGRYFRLFILLALVLGLLAVAYKFGLSDTIAKLRKNATTDRASSLWHALVIVLWLAVFAFLLMVFDYAKIRTVVDCRRSMLLAAVASVAFALRRCWRTIPLFALNLVIVGALFAVYLLVESQFSSTTIASMIGLFVVQQLSILSRIWMRLSFFSTQLAYYKSVIESRAEPGASRKRDN